MKVENLKTTTQFTSVLKSSPMHHFRWQSAPVLQKNCRFMCEVTYHLSI